MIITICPFQRDITQVLQLVRYFVNFEATGRSLSRVPVSRKLHESWLFARPAAWITFTSTNMRFRLPWCRYYRDWSTDQWGIVIFPNGFGFSITIDSWSTFILRLAATRYVISNVLEMFWSGQVPYCIVVHYPMWLKLVWCTGMRPWNPMFTFSWFKLLLISFQWIANSTWISSRWRFSGK